MTRNRFRSECSSCSQVFQHYVSFCPSCRAMTDVRYDLDQVVRGDSANPYQRFLDLLPVADPELLPADAQYTPTIHAQSLGAQLGLPWLYLKDETGLPTATTKDRMAAVALPYLYELGVREFATSSTGNSSSAYAQAIARVPEMTMYVFTAEAFRNRLTLAGSPQVVDVVVRDATFVEAFEAAGEYATDHGITSERGFFNPGRREGLKLAWLEAVEQVPRRIDWYVQAVSSAMGVFGVFKAAGEMVELGWAEATPRLLCVQQESCAPMVTAWRDGSATIRSRDVVPNPRGIGTAILRGDPTRTYPHVHRIVRASNGTFTAVSEAAIRDARDMVEELEGVSVCFSAAAAVAGLAELARTGYFSPADTFLVNLTGGERPATPTTEQTQWVSRVDRRWNFEDIRRPNSPSGNFGR